MSAPLVRVTCVDESHGYTWDTNTLAWVVATASAGPGGAGDASAANQTTEISRLTSILADTDKIPPLGQALAAGSTPVVLTAIQQAALTPPAAITGFSTEATLALIKAKTDNLDALLSSRTKPADQQHVIVDSSAAVAVTGTFWQATQPVSAASLPLPTGAATETTVAAVSGKLPATLGQKTMSASMGVVVASDQGPLSIQHGLTGATNVFKTGTITSTAATADQVVLTYTVTAGKTFYLQYLVMYGRLTTLAATATILGALSLETPSGTKCITFDDVNPTTSELEFNPLTFTEPIPIAAGTVVRVVVTPAATTSMLWRANFGGYEK